MNNDRLLSQAISISRFPMMVLIVFIHAVLQEENMPTLVSNMMIFIPETMCRIAVPTFFLISGFLFFFKRNVSASGFYSSQLKKRVRSLLVPYILWNTIELVLRWINSLPFMYDFFPQMVRNKITLLDVINAFGEFTLEPRHADLGIYDPASWPADSPLWFIRDLLVMMLFTPLIYKVMKSKVGPVACMVLIGCFIIGIWPEACLYFSLTGVTFFSLGCFLGARNINPVKYVKNFPLTISVLSIVYLGFAIARVTTYGDEISSRLFASSVLLGSCLFLLICSYAAIKGVKPSRFSGAPTFFMYAFHGLMMSIMLRIVLTIIMPQSALAYIAAYFIDGTVVIVISLVVYYVVARVAPYFAALLTGSRTNKG